MGHKRLAVLLIVMTVCLGTRLAAAQQAAARTDTEINQGWEFRQMAPAPKNIDGQWRPAQVPGDVHSTCCGTN